MPWLVVQVPLGSRSIAIVRATRTVRAPATLSGHTVTMLHMRRYDAGAYGGHAGSQGHQ